MKTHISSKQTTAATRRLQSARRNYDQIKKIIDSVAKKPTMKIYTPSVQWGETTDLLNNNNID